MNFSFFVPGVAKGQPRARSFFNKKTGRAGVYDPSTAEGWKSLIASYAKAVGLTGQLLDGPIYLTMSCEFPRPKSHFRSGKNGGLLKDSAPRHFYLSKPDLDNIVKAAKDCLTQIGAWRDDRQVCVERLEKTWAPNCRTPGTHFEIKQLPDEEN